MHSFPPGVVQALSGDDSLGPMMVEHPEIDKISFIGSINTGKLVMASCAKIIKRVALELGGNDLAIICSDVDIKAIIPNVSIEHALNSTKQVNIGNLVWHMRIPLLRTAMHGDEATIRPRRYLRHLQKTNLSLS